MKKTVVMLFILPFLLAGSPQPFTWGIWGEGDSIQQPVEQQTVDPNTADQTQWVVNNVPETVPGAGDDVLHRCAWDADDQINMGNVGGNLAPGATATGTKCWVADTVDHSFYLDVNSKSPDLVVTLSFPQNEFWVQPCCGGTTPLERLSSTFTLPAKFDPVARLYRYEMCVVGVDYDLRYTPGFPSIPNSGTAPNGDFPGRTGGYGIISNAVVTTHNPTGQTVRGINGVFRLVGGPGTGAVIGGGARCPQVPTSDPVWTKYGDNGPVFPPPTFAATYPGAQLWFVVP